MNSNWPLFLDKSTSQYYLFDGSGWMTSSSLISGWTATATLSPEMAKVPADPNWKDLKPYIPAPPGSAASYPVVFYSTTPAEVVVFGGKPNFAPIPGTQLVYATNTDSDVFKYTPTGAFYYLTSGRWFSSPTALGPWSFASNNLPPDFANIPIIQSAGQGPGLGAGHSRGRRRRPARTDSDDRDGGSGQGGGECPGRVFRQPAVCADSGNFTDLRHQHSQ